MMETKDWLSGLIGIFVLCLGALPLLNKVNVGPPWFKLQFLPLEVFTYIVAIAGFYLLIESVIEITNSNVIGWASFLIAALIVAVGLLPLLASFHIGPPWFALSFLFGNLNAADLIYRVIFVVEGMFLIIATFAMEM